MKTGYCTQTLVLLSLALVTLRPSRAGEPQQPSDETDVSAISTAAFKTLNSVPSKGLEQSAGGIERIIADHKRLARSQDSSKRHLSVVLADAVAYSLFYEIRRADFSRRGIDRKLSMESIPFEKATAVRLWRTNMPEFEPLIREILKENDVITNYVASHSSAEDVLSGRMIEKVPGDTIAPRITELRGQASLPISIRKRPSPDEQLVYTLTIYQAFRDLTVIVDLYEKSGLPGESVALRNSIDAVLSQYPDRRVDDGMKASAFKVWSTFRHYYPEASTDDVVGPAEEYTLRLSIALAPFMNDTSVLPDIAQNALRKMNK